jgi:hypothetical protein
MIEETSLPVSPAFQSAMQNINVLYNHLPPDLRKCIDELRNFLKKKNTIEAVLEIFFFIRSKSCSIELFK